MTRFVPVTVLVLLAASRVASADMGSLPNGATLKFNRLFIHENGGALEEPDRTPESLWNYFNLAHCQCSQTPPSGFVETNFALELTLTTAGTTTGLDRALKFWVGTTCDTTDTTERDRVCHQIGPATIQTISSIVNATNVTIPLFDLMNPEPGTTECQTRELDATVWALADVSETQDSKDDFSLSNVIKTDTRAPDLPTEFRALGGDESILITWEAPTTTTDVYGYQALCARAATDTPGKSSGRPDQRYATALTLCGVNKSIDLGAGTAIAGGGAPVTLPDALKNLDSAFLCGEAFSPSATELRIDGLENGVEYKVVFLTVDRFQNARGTFFTSTVTPRPSTDFWEDIHRPGVEVEGGLCLLAETYGDNSALTGALRAFRDNTLARTQIGRWLTRAYYATIGKLGESVHGSTATQVLAAILLAPLVAIALAWYWLTLPGLLGLLALLWLFRYRRVIAPWLARVAATTAIAIIALAPQHAHAQSGYQPYWQNSNLPSEDNQVAPNDPSLVTWHAGVRVGPYLPDVDSKLGLSPGPFKQMFKGSRPMPMLDVDRILWTGFGQAGVGFSIGYMQWFGHAFVDGSLPEDDPRMRAAADTNTFRLIPMALTGIYRFTMLDDDYGIPVIPYVRAGLAYDIWWLSARNSRVCKDGVDPDDPACELDKPRGGSLGWTASIGLAIRAERIDASTAMSMQQSGIQHAGIYAELSIADVDGFGSEKKLSVGDRTWFAGVDFEF